MSLLSFRSLLPSEKFVHFHNKFIIKPLILINYSILRSHYHYYLTKKPGNNDSNPFTCNKQKIIQLNKHDHLYRKPSFNHDFSFVQTKKFSSINKVNENRNDNKESNVANNVNKMYSDTLLL